MADRSVLVRLKGDISDFNRAMLAGSASAKAFTGSLETSTDRMGNLVQTSLALGPALVPIGAAAVPAISGLTNQLAFAALGAGVAAIAFQGVGDALTATNDYAIEPTAANLEKMHQALDTLGPAGQHFVGFLQELRPEMQRLQDIAQEGLFPGAEAGLTDLMELLPQFESIVSTVATTMGDLLAEAGDNLNDPRWVEFFTFLENEARPTLLDMGRTLGNFAEGFANLWMAFDPLSDNFSKSFLQMSRDFAQWTDGLAETQGFQDFVDYINRVGPKAWDTLGALGNALLQIVEAAAPVGEVMLPIITAVADVFAAIASSPVGPVLIGAAAGLSAISRAIALYNVANGTALSGFLTRVGGSGVGFRLAAAGAGIFALSLTDLDEKLGVTNTATFAMAGLVAGPLGVAVGATAGLVLDLASANDESAAAFDRASDAIMNNTGTLEEQAAALQAAKDSSGGGFQGQIDDLAAGELADTLAKNAAAAQDAKFAEAGLADAMDGASAATRKQVEASLDLIGVHNELSNLLLQERGGLRGFEAAIDAATDAAKKNGRTLDINTEAGRENQEALDHIADAYNNLTPAQQANEKTTQRARKAFISTARQMGLTGKEARALADDVLGIPDKRKINIKAETEQARRDLMRIQGFIDGMHGKTVKIHVVGGTPGGITMNADGGYIAGPGGPRDDAIPAMLSNGEYVINAAATAKYLPLLNRINAVKFADGGPVASRLPSVIGTTTANPPPTMADWSPAQLRRALKDAFPQSFRIVGPQGNQRLEVMGA